METFYSLKTYKSLASVFRVLHFYMLQCDSSYKHQKDDEEEES